MRADIRPELSGPYPVARWRVVSAGGGFPLHFGLEVAGRFGVAIAPVRIMLLERGQHRFDRRLGERATMIHVFHMAVTGDIEGDVDCPNPFNEIFIQPALPNGNYDVTVSGVDVDLWFMFDVEMLTEPTYDPAKYVMVQPSDDADWYEKSSVATKDALKQVQIAYSNSLADRSPAIADFFANFALTADDVSGLAFEISATGVEPAAAAAAWVAANSDRVDAMLGL